MSATGRNKPGNERKTLDQYDTPPWCVEILLEDPDIADRLRLLADQAAQSGGSVRWVDPCVGAGQLVYTCERIFEPRYWSVCDIEMRGRFGVFGKGIPRAKTVEITQGDGIDWLLAGPPAGVRWSLCISNPPYCLTDAFVRAAVRSCGVVALLLRTSWAGAEGKAGTRYMKRIPAGEPIRNEWLRAHACDVRMLPHRPSFDGVGTDSATYSWFVWYGASRSTFKVLPCIPKERRT